MSRIDFNSPRLFVDAPFDVVTPLTLGKAPGHYLTNVLRLAPGSRILVFNGREGEWRASLGGTRSAATLALLEQVRPQPASSRVHYCFAPLKHARLDYLVQKAVEMGAGVLQPVMTRRTQGTRINIERMRANVIEAAEQCGVLAIPDVREPLRFADVLARWPADSLLVFCDEDAEVEDPIAALRQARPAAAEILGIIVGPEGGFDDAERSALVALPRSLRLSLGPRILRADTAAVAAMALVQAVLGDGTGERD